MKVYLKVMKVFSISITNAYMRSELTEKANIVISFYSSSLASCVGPQFKPPSLEFLARQWFDASSMGFETNFMILLLMLSFGSR